ncbi:MAG: threonylcarbamoyl-AMP synthase [Nitrospirae bacterium]|nr:threonylcarbamoyl-AMP synthase [Nitrospirota bacterium]
MLILPFTEKKSRDIFKRALDVLKSGGIIAYPTESFYALGVLAADESAIKKLFELKKRPVGKPLPVIVGDMDTLKSVVENIPANAGNLIKKCWPGPLTMIFKAKGNVPFLLTGGSGKVAVRIPGESVALHLTRALKLPVTSTSANPSGERPAEDPGAIMKYFGDKIDLIIDGGKAPGGRPSTIVDVTLEPPVVLREGRIALND